MFEMPLKTDFQSVKGLVDGVQSGRNQISPGATQMDFELEAKVVLLLFLLN